MASRSRFLLFFLCFLLNCGNPSEENSAQPLMQSSCGILCAHEDHEPYLNAEQRRPFFITIENGLFFGASDLALEGTGMYVLSPGGDFYFYSVSSESTDFKHSFFLRGKPVACAGWAKFKAGKLTFLDNGSGHYKPSAKHLWQMVQVLKEHGADLESLQLRIH